MYARRSARVLLLDASGRILLLRFGFVDSDGWVTPGGGVHDGASLVHALARLLESLSSAATTVPVELPWHH